jgi:hypothetical protein
MKKYLFSSKNESDCNNFFILNAKTRDEAQYNFAKNFVKKDMIFMNYIDDKSVNMSFAEQFWIYTDDEQNIFNNKGEIIIDDNEFTSRVKNYFGENINFAKEYLDYYFSEKVINSFSIDLLIYIWVKDWNSFIVTDMENIEIIE